MNTKILAKNKNISILYNDNTINYLIIIKGGFIMLKIGKSKKKSNKKQETPEELEQFITNFIRDIEKQRKKNPNIACTIVPLIEPYNKLVTIYEQQNNSKKMAKIDKQINNIRNYISPCIFNLFTNYTTEYKKNLLAKAEKTKFLMM